MDLRSQLELLERQIVKGEYRETEHQLLQLHAAATKANDSGTLDLVLPLLVMLYSLMDPPDLTRATEFALERERINDTGYSKLQTALLFYYSAGDYPRAVAKLHEAIDKGTAEGDDRTLYTSLSLLGQALLEMDQKHEASVVLARIEEMITAKKRFVIGDETGFLESARKHGLEVQRVGRIAAVLEPLCRDPEFAERLKNLQ